MQLPGTRHRMEFSVVVIGVHPFLPVVSAGRRSLSRHLLDVSNVNIALLIDGVPELLFGPTRIGENFGTLGIKDQDMGISSNPISFDLLGYGPDVVLDGRR